MTMATRPTAMAAPLLVALKADMSAQALRAPAPVSVEMASLRAEKSVTTTARQAVMAVARPARSKPGINVATPRARVVLSAAIARASQENHSRAARRIADAKMERGAPRIIGVTGVETLCATPANRAIAVSWIVASVRSFRPFAAIVRAMERRPALRALEIAEAASSAETEHSAKAKDAMTTIRAITTVARPPVPSRPGSDARALRAPVLPIVAMASSRVQNCVMTAT